MKSKIALALSAVLALAPAFAPTLAYAQGAAVQQGYALSAADATTVANELGMTLDEALSSGAIASTESGSGFVVTESGAAALASAKGTAGSLGGFSIAGLNVAELTALAAGFLGLLVIIANDQDAKTPGTPVTSSTPGTSTTATPGT